jgi:hypothetical protein
MIGRPEAQGPLWVAARVDGLGEGRIDVDRGAEQALGRGLDLVQPAEGGAIGFRMADDQRRLVERGIVGGGQLRQKLGRQGHILAVHIGESPDTGEMQGGFTHAASVAHEREGGN